MVVNDKVIMTAKGKKKYLNSRYNPHKLEGTILTNSDGRVIVEWDNFERNGYDFEEIELLKTIIELW